ncbi:MAG: radical SAM protein [Verrucomicrobia bacterium]|nr:radical SAM protein [Verrucomicrobiota bacterium]
MSTYLTTTQSLCRICRRLIPAQVHIADGSVWFHKICPDHGFQKARVHGDADAYLKLGDYHSPATIPQEFATASQGCPDSCGLCPEHEQHVCLPILEITDHCNLDCPICLVDNPGKRHLTRAEVAIMLDSLIRSEGHIDVVNLSGGEPTLNPHFRDIVEECLSRQEILRVSVSTSGTVLVRNSDLLRFLAERRVIVSLQFDGISDDVYLKLRGQPLLAEKLRLIEACAALNAPMSLTATIAKGINDHQVGAIADILFEHDHLLSAMFQPAAYTGNGAHMERPLDATTIPEVIAGLKGAGKGVVAPEDFSPLPCSHPACFALAFYLKNEGHGFLPIKRLVSPERYLGLLQNRAIFGTDADSFQQVTAAVYDIWAGLPPPGKNRLTPPSGAGEPGVPCGCNPVMSEQALRAVRKLLTAATAGGYSPRQAMETGERAVKSIFIHQFMDPDTFDLARVRKCCQVYPQADGRLMPACVFNNLRRGRT